MVYEATDNWNILENDQLHFNNRLQSNFGFVEDEIETYHDNKTINMAKLETHVG